MTKDEKTTQILKYAFVALGIAELFGHAFGWSYFNEFTKPLLMPLLLVYFRKGLKGTVNLSFIFAAFALVFSWVGDVALMYVYKREVYFLIGLGGFAVAQLLYVFSFKNARNEELQEYSVGEHILYIAPFVIGLLWMLWSSLGDLKFPVMVYASLISSMALAAVYRGGRTNKESFHQVILGAALFILSDTLLAIDKFHAPMENAKIWVMSTYILAQWNIINGLQKHFNAST